MLAALRSRRNHRVAFGRPSERERDLLRCRRAAVASMVAQRFPVVSGAYRRRSCSLARALSNRSTATVLMFYSAACPLCQSIRADLDKLHEKHPWMTYVEACAEEFEQWAPEMLRYSVEAVPCLVLLDAQGACAVPPCSDKDMVRPWMAALMLASCSFASGAETLS